MLLEIPWVMKPDQPLDQHGHSSRIFASVCLTVAIALGIALFLVRTAEAQSNLPAGVLAGRVLDAGTGQPVPAAVVTLEPTAPGLMIDPLARSALTSVRSLVTGS